MVWVDSALEETGSSALVGFAGERASNALVSFTELALFGSLCKDKGVVVELSKLDTTQDIRDGSSALVGFTSEMRFKALVSFAESKFCGLAKDEGVVVEL